MIDNVLNTMESYLNPTISIEESTSAIDTLKQQTQETLKPYLPEIEANNANPFLYEGVSYEGLDFKQFHDWEEIDETLTCSLFCKHEEREKAENDIKSLMETKHPHLHSLITYDSTKRFVGNQGVSKVNCIITSTVDIKSLSEGTSQKPVTEKELDAIKKFFESNGFTVTTHNEPLYISINKIFKSPNWQEGEKKLKEELTIHLGDKFQIGSIMATGRGMEKGNISTTFILHSLNDIHALSNGIKAS